MEYQYTQYLDRVKNRIKKHPEEITYAKQGLAQLKKYYEQEEQKYPSRCYWSTPEKEAEVYHKLEEYLTKYLAQESTDILRKKIKVNHSLQPVKFTYLWKKLMQEELIKTNPIDSMYHYYGKVEDYTIQYLLELYYYTKLFQKEKFNDAFLTLYHEIEQGNTKVLSQIKMMPEEEKRKILRDCQLYEKMREMNEEEQVYYYMKEIDGPHLEQSRRKIVIHNLQNAIKFLDEFGRLTFYLTLSQNKKEMLGLPNQYIQTKEDLLAQFKTENLQSLETSQLLLLNSFWQNRAEKEMDQISRNLFLEHYLEPEKEENQEEAIEYILYRYWITKQVDRDMRKEIKLSTTQKTNLLTQKKNSIQQNIVYDQVGEDFKQRYHLNFALRQENKEQISFVKDALQNCMVFGLQDLAYELKTEAAVELIDFYRNSATCYNWGYVPEEAGEENESSVILIAFDYPGMDGILRLHFQRDKLLETWEAEGEDTYIPVYQGKEDLKIENKIIKNYIYTPMNREQESAYIEKYKETNQESLAENYVKHIVANCLGKIKYKKIKPILPDKWYDIKTRQYGCKRMGKFEPEENHQVR